MKRVVAEHHLDTSVKLSHQVVGAWWDAGIAQWKIKIRPVDNPDAEFFDHADILINSTGVLKCVNLKTLGPQNVQTLTGCSNWKWPTIPGLEKFKNKTHTAAWDTSLELADKTIGIIGNGSSAVQVTTATHSSIYIALSSVPLGPS